MKVRELSEVVKQFFATLENLGSGERAILKRNAGNMLRNSRGGALGVFYKTLPTKIPFWQEEVWFLAATLCSLTRTRMNIEQNQLSERTIDFGWTMRQARKTESQDNRFRALLDCQTDVEGSSLAHRLRQMVKLADGRGIHVDWPQLLMDLIYWDSSSKFVQKKWARSYFGKGQLEEFQPITNKGEDQC